MIVSEFVMLCGLALGVALASFIGALAVRRWATRLGLVDVSNYRSSHVRPTPRGGGLPLAVASLVGFFTFVLSESAALPVGVLWVCVGLLLVAAVSLADDRWHLPVASRLVAHFAAAVAMVAGGVVLREVEIPGGGLFPLGWMGVPMTILWMVGVTNAYNFMDGIDGIASGQALVSAATLGCLALIYRDETAFVFMLLLASATSGFLIVNWPPAKIFLGDVGSTFLGMSFATWTVLLSLKPGGPPLFAWAAVLSPFLFDATLTLARRVARGDQWSEAHREHYYQRLIRCGWRHEPVSILYVAMSVVCGGAVVLSYGYGVVPGQLVPALALGQFCGLVILVRHLEARVKAGGAS